MWWPRSCLGLRMPTRRRRRARRLEDTWPRHTPSWAAGPSAWIVLLLRRRLRGFSEKIPRAPYLRGWEPTPALVVVGL